MSKKKIKSKLSIAFATVALCAACSFTSVIYASADEKIETNANNALQEKVEKEQIEERLFTNLTIAINGGSGEVWTTVKNTFTLFPSTVYVIVLLYRSDEYCEDYTNMTLVATNSTTDLDMGNTIEARASTEWKQSYWMGRMRYRIGGADWDERTVGGLYSADGEFLGLA